MADESPAEHASLDYDAGVITITLQRTEKLNAVSDEILAVLDRAVTTLASDDAARVLVIRAVGSYFTAGIDLRGELFRAMREPSEFPGAHFRRVYSSLHRLFDQIEAVEKPVILAAQGPCLGVGVELAASCDFRFASEEAVFGLPEIKLGALAGSGGTGRLSRLIGPHWTKWIAVAGQQVSAAQALQIGLVHEVTAAGQLDQRVGTFVNHLIDLPGEALGLAKLAVDLSTDSDRHTQRNIERIAVTTLFGRDEFNRRVSRFENPSDE